MHCNVGKAVSIYVEWSIGHVRKLRGSLDIFAPGASSESPEHSWVEQEAD